MVQIKDQIIRIIQADAGAKAASLATQLVHSESHEKEAILAGLEFERWLEQCCRECLN